MGLPWKQRKAEVLRDFCVMKGNTTMGVSHSILFMIRRSAVDLSRDGCAVRPSLTCDWNNTRYWVLLCIEFQSMYLSAGSSSVRLTLGIIMIFNGLFPEHYRALSRPPEAAQSKQGGRIRRGASGRLWRADIFLLSSLWRSIVLFFKAHTYR